jgi:hypothetical protein
MPDKEGRRADKRLRKRTRGPVHALLADDPALWAWHLVGPGPRWEDWAAMNRRTLWGVSAIALLALLVGGCGGSAGGLSRRSTYFYEFPGLLSSPQIEPTRIVFAANGRDAVTGLSWRGWGSSVAIAEGTARIGAMSRIRVFVALSAPLRHAGRRVYMCYRTTMASGTSGAFCLPQGGDPLRPTAAVRARSCGSVPKMIQNHVTATWTVSCSQARSLMHELLGGSKACYPHGYTAHPRCKLEWSRNVQLEGFQCSATYDASTNVLKGRCVQGRKLVTGTAGP